MINYQTVFRNLKSLLLIPAVCLVTSCAKEKAPFDEDFRACLKEFDSSKRLYEPDEYTTALNRIVKDKLLPDWEFTDLNDKSFSIHSSKSPIVILNFNSFRGEGYKYVYALEKWSQNHNEDLLIIVNCFNSEEQLLNSPSGSLEVAMKNPYVHIVPSSSFETDRGVEYVNGVNVDDPVCSVYYIGKDHKVKHFDPFYYLVERDNDLRSEYAEKRREGIEVAEPDFNEDAYFFIEQRISKYLMN